MNCPRCKERWEVDFCRDVVENVCDKCVRDILMTGNTTESTEYLKTVTANQTYLDYLNGKKRYPRTKE